MIDTISCLNGATTMPYDLRDDILYSSLAGFHGVEIWIDKLRKFLKEFSKEDLKRFLTEANISAPSLCPFGGLIFSPKDIFEKRVREMENFLEIGNFIGSKYIVVCAEGFGGKSFDEAKEIYVSRLRELSRVVEKYDIKIAFEWFKELPYAIDIVNTVDEENIGFLIDTFHWYRGDGNIENLRKIPSQKIFFVHISDCENLPRDKLRDENRLYCGLGVIPLIDILKILDDKDYEGYLSVEIFRREYWKHNAQIITIDAYDTLIGVGLEAGVRIR